MEFDDQQTEELLGMVAHYMELRRTHNELLSLIENSEARVNIVFDNRSDRTLDSDIGGFFNTMLEERGWHEQFLEIYKSWLLAQIQDQLNDIAVRFGINIQEKS